MGPDYDLSSTNKEDMIVDFIKIGAQKSPKVKGSSVKQQSPQPVATAEKTGQQ
jgi:hypothetical protein